MKEFVKYCLYTLLTIALFAQCTEDVKPIPLTYWKVFTGDDHKAWSIQYLTLKQDGKEDQTFALASCEADDQYIFYANSDRQYTISNGTKKCSTDDPDVLVNDTWAFLNATATLTIIIPISPFPSSPLPFFVKQVDNNTMTLQIFVDQENTISYLVNFKAVSQN
ncbi:MAG TPA: hypothetical protein VL443_21140 [Cyclobacteriaceae bacterium]|jgi:hypothetical protein|nr:hypothetical protein [Cyclobacteriaceae bacterium]